MALNPADIRADFPALSQTIHGHPLVYLDNAATTQKPHAMIEAISQFYAQDNANIHRGVHELSQRATTLFERCREKARGFLNAEHTRNIVFTKGTTESINLLAESFARPRLSPGDEIIISLMEHHSNFVPWQQLCEKTGAVLKVIPLLDTSDLDLNAYEQLLSKRTKIVSITQLSNTLGVCTPIETIIAMAKAVGAAVIVDGAQSAPHMPIDVRAMGCDFFVCSAHKLYGPTGVGFLYASPNHLDDMLPYQTGGGMIRTVSKETSTFASVPERMEAGTPNIAGVVGTAATLDYLAQIGMDDIAAYEATLYQSLRTKLKAIPGLQLIGAPEKSASVASFTLEGVHPHDIGTLLDSRGVAVRSGHHCTMPLMTHLGLPATTRASLSFYNTDAEIDVLCDAIEYTQKVFR